MGITVFDHLFLGLLNMDCEVWLNDRICENVVSSGRSLNPKNSKWRILGDVKRQEILGDIQIVAEIYTLSFAIVTPQTPNAHYCLWHFGPTISYMLGLSSVIIKYQQVYIQNMWYRLVYPIIAIGHIQLSDR